MSSSEQIGVSAGPAEQNLCIGHLVDQYPIGLHVALTPALPYALQRMIAPSLGAIVAAPLDALQVSTKSGGCLSTRALI
jgi:hypothetical protein